MTDVNTFKRTNMPKKEIIKIEDLTVRYKNFTAVDKVSLSICENEVFGIIGPNGAGKTSMIEAVEGLRPIESGNVEILGFEPKRDRIKLYDKIGVQLQQSSYPDQAKVEDVCKLFSSFYENSESYESLLNNLGIENCKKDYIRNLSGGQKQKLSILLSLLNRPKVVFWDELTTGLDPLARHELYEKIQALKTEGLTIVLITHFMEEVEKLCDRVALMKSGKILFVGTPDEIVAKYNAKNLDDVFIQISSEN